MITTTNERIVGYGPLEEPAVQQLERCLSASESTAKGVLCADHHKGYGMPIGGVIASQVVVMPAGVGYDIGCGNCAVRTNLNANDVLPGISRIMDEIFSTISFGMGRKNSERVIDHPVFDLIDNSPVKPQRALLSLAQAQLGTVGGGNHYVDLFRDLADDHLWIGVHFGSRGFGHKTAKGFLALAEGKEWSERTNESMDATPATILIESPTGQDYLEAMSIAGDYAYAGRNWVVDRLLTLLGAKDTLRIHNHHNYAWWEEHFGERWLVTRKGSTPAFPGQKGFVGASMGDNAVILEGTNSEYGKAALYSTVHGAGRVMGRGQAKGKWKNGELVRAGLVDWSAWQVELIRRGVELRGGDADEAPQCYKRLDEVLQYHGDTVKVLHQLRPIGVAMASKDTEDLYKD